MPIVMNYEAMFGSESNMIVDKLIPEILPVMMRESIIKKVCNEARKNKRWVLMFVVGTKPCFYKFYGSITAAEKYKIPFFIVNAGQHYEEILVYGIKEFNYEDKIAVNLCIRGDLSQKAAEILLKISWLARYLKKNYPDVVIAPVVLGDTILTSTVPQAWMFSIIQKGIHLEAGLRSMTPSVIKSIGKVSLERFFSLQRNNDWILLTTEPFPEQYDTYTASAGCEFLFPPLEINKEHLIREGYDKNKVFTIGGVVVDALNLKLKEKPKKSIFSIYPQLSKGEWIRIDIHRKENLTRQRLSNIVFAIRDLVIKKKYNVNFVEMSATKIALNEFGLYRYLFDLTKYKNFLYTPVWKEYANVIEFYKSKNCILALTDSGGLQEELNMLKKPCATIRFNTDRPETVFDGKGNFIIPPINKDFIINCVSFLIERKSLFSHIKPLYGKNVGERFIKIVLQLMKKNKMFSWAQEQLNFWKEDGY